MTNYSTRFAVHPEDVKQYDTTKLRQHFLIEKLFVDNTVQLVYSHFDRLIIGGVKPVGQTVKLETFDTLKASYFMERREIGIINVGETGTVTADGKVYTLKKREALYIGKGTKEVSFASEKNGALFYFNSANAHATYPSKHITLADAETVELGSQESANARTIRKLMVQSVVQTCQLQMGLTELKPGSIWNTMPPHVHDRRMEAYFYFGLAEGATVCHFMGEPTETRHLWVQNHQAVISPPWSIHSGAGTSNYSFIWGMAGENLDYTDMDGVKPQELR
jgi:4-deoxy-L-threo-5-hexosulose-uronate ketol-isomerase